MSATAIILDVGSLATAAAVGVGVFQLRSSRQQAVSAFEDSLTRLYRALVAEFPVEVFTNEPPPIEDLAKYRSAFYRYFDLCNEQIFLRSTKRISAPTWEQWRDGIKTNLQRDSFRRVWEQQFDKQTGGDFAELRHLMRDYDTDPASWDDEDSTAEEPETDAPDLYARIRSAPSFDQLDLERNPSPDGPDDGFLEGQEQRTARLDKPGDE